MSIAAFTPLTGAFPTGTPTSLSAVATTGYPDVDVLVKVSAGTGTVTLIGYYPTPAAWFPIGDLALDSSVTGGNALDRRTIGVGGPTHLALWVKTAGATITNAWIATGVRR